MIRGILALALVCAGVIAARAEPTRKIVGTWIVSSEEDRFGAGGTYLAMTIDSGSNGFGARCIERELSLALMPATDPMEKGARFNIKVRTDMGPVVDLKGVSINPRVIQIDATAEQIRMVRAGRETAVRVETETGTSRTLVFTTRDTVKAFAQLAKECKVD